MFCFFCSLVWSLKRRCWGKSLKWRWAPWQRRRRSRRLRSTQTWWPGTIRRTSAFSKPGAEQTCNSDNSNVSNLKRKCQISRMYLLQVRFLFHLFYVKPAFHQDWLFKYPLIFHIFVQACHYSSYWLFIVHVFLFVLFFDWLHCSSILTTCNLNSQYS